MFSQLIHQGWAFIIRWWIFFNGSYCRYFVSGLVDRDSTRSKSCSFSLVEKDQAIWREIFHSQIIKMCTYLMMTTLVIHQIKLIILLCTSHCDANFMCLFTFLSLNDQCTRSNLVDDQNWFRVLSLLVMRTCCWPRANKPVKAKSEPGLAWTFWRQTYYSKTWRKQRFCKNCVCYELKIIFR